MEFQPAFECCKVKISKQFCGIEVVKGCQPLPDPFHGSAAQFKVGHFGKIEMINLRQPFLHGWKIRNFIRQGD